MKILTLALISLLAFPVIELEKRSFVNDKVELLVPKNFKALSKAEIKERYQFGDKPAFHLTNDSGTVFLSLHYYIEKIADDAFYNEEVSFTQAKSAFKAGLEEGFPGAIWKDEGIKTIDERKVWYAKIIYPGAGYQYSFLAYVNKRLFKCTFACADYLLPEWEETAELIVNSFRIK
jgi:hypothetical protein